MSTTSSSWSWHGKGTCRNGHGTGPPSCPRRRLTLNPPRAEGGGPRRADGHHGGPLSVGHPPPPRPARSSPARTRARRCPPRCCRPASSTRARATALCRPSPRRSLDAEVRREWRATGRGRALDAPPRTHPSPPPLRALVTPCPREPIGIGLRWFALEERMVPLILSAGWRRSGRRNSAGGMRAASVPARRCSSARRPSVVNRSLLGKCCLPPVSPTTTHRAQAPTGAFPSSRPWHRIRNATGGQSKGDAKGTQPV
jgi:hypothetical protein